MGTYSYSGKVEFLTVGVTGTYDITAYGGRGGADTGYGSGGYGAEISGSFNLTAGEKLEIVVGGAGAGVSNRGAGGGGGSFVLASTDGGLTYGPLLVAGGGGGAGLSGSGGAASFANSSAGSSTGGVSGYTSPQNVGGGGGAGVKSSGYSPSIGYGSYNNGGRNGSGGYAGGPGNAQGGNGGFGGGGGGGNQGGGGGSGYSGGSGGGGDGRPASTGGTSFDSAGTPLVAQSASTENTARGGNGLVVLSTAAPLSTLVSFKSATTGAAPQASLVADSDGNLFGTTKTGGTGGVGTVFELKNTGTLAAPVYASPPMVLLNFNTTNGANPDGSLIIDSNGNLFGTTSAGGSGAGLMFEMKNTGTLAAPTYGTSPTQEVLFSGTAGPVGSLTTDRFFNLYGTTTSGGVAGDGSVFLMANIGTLTAPVYNTANTSTPATFTGTGNGASPFGSLIFDAAGDLYGTTAVGGASNDGTVFELKVSSSSSTGYTTPITLATFTGAANGAIPTGSLIADGAGDLFGTTLIGGANNLGTVFELKNTGTTATPGYANGAITVASFNGAGTGSLPKGSLIIDAAGDLFGTASTGGANNDGVVFEIADIGGVYENTPIIVDTFAGTGNGATPVGSLITDAAGDLYGTTSAGGANGNGTAFEITNSGFVSIQTLVAFNSADGRLPRGSLIADANGDLFGTAYTSNANGAGTVFELKNNGTLAAPAYASTQTTLVAFNTTNGARPFGSLIADANGDLFGTSASGGDANGDGTVFELKNNGTLAAPGFASTPTTLAAFNNTDGAIPTGSLIADANGDLFGTTSNGGGGGMSVIGGTVFELKNTGTPAAPSYANPPTTLVAFNDADGDIPRGSLIIDAHGDLFGTTSNGTGGNSHGTVFELQNTGNPAAPYANTPATLISFNNTDGSGPVGSLMTDTAGDLFGTTAFGGDANADGTIFELKNNGTLAAPAYGNTPTTLIGFSGSNGSHPYGSLIADAAGDLFGTTGAGGVYGDGTVFELKNLGSLAAPIYASTPTVSVSFNNKDGATPSGDLFADAGGHLYGTTQSGGDANGDGTVFEVNGLTFVVNPTVSVATFQANQAALNESASGIQISDTAANILAGLANLAADASHITSIKASDGNPVVVGVGKFTPDEPALNKIGAGFSIVGQASAIQSSIDVIEADASQITAITAQNGTVAVSVATFGNDATALNKIAGHFAISDTAANIANGIGNLQVDQANITTITASDGNPVSVGVGKFTPDQQALNKIGTGFSIVGQASTIQSSIDTIEGDASQINVISAQNGTVAVSVATFGNDATALNKIAGHFAISDTAANIATGIGNLQADQANITTITASDGNPVSVGVGKFTPDQQALNKIGVGFSILGQSSSISSSFDTLEADVSHINAVTFADTTTPVLNLTAAQATNDASLIAKITTPYVENVANGNGTTTTTGHGSNLTINAVAGGNDTITGGSSGESFVFKPTFGSNTITDFATYLSGAGNDTITLPSTEFANFAAVMADATYSGMGAPVSTTITAMTGDKLVLPNVTQSAFQTAGGDFKFA